MGKASDLWKPGRSARKEEKQLEIRLISGSPPGPTQPSSCARVLLGAPSCLYPALPHGGPPVWLTSAGSGEKSHSHLAPRKCPRQD